MKIRNIIKAGVFAVCASTVAAPLTGCSNSAKSDKAADEATEQTETVADATGYKLFTPATVEEGKTYPIIVVVGTDVDATTAVFTADTFQKETPAYVYSAESEASVKSVIEGNQVDTDRVYSVGKTPEENIYAASLIVDGAIPADMKDKKIIYFSTDAERVNEIQDSLRGTRISYTYAEWGANLPVERQSELASTMLEKGQPVNIFQFENGTVTAEGATIAAASIPSVRAWILAQKK